MLRTVTYQNLPSWQEAGVSERLQKGILEERKKAIHILLWV